MKRLLTVVVDVENNEGTDEPDNDDDDDRTDGAIGKLLISYIFVSVTTNVIVTE